MYTDDEQVIKQPRQQLQDGLQTRNQHQDPHEASLNFA